MKKITYLKTMLTLMVYFVICSQISTAQTFPLNGTITKTNNCTCLTANPTGGTPPYMYIWSNGATTQTICPQPAGGAFTVIIMDSGAQLFQVTTTLDCCKMKCPNDTIICFNFPDSMVLKNKPTAATSAGSGTGGPGGCIIDSIWNNSNGVFPVGTTLVLWHVRFSDGSTDSCTQKIIRLAPSNVSISFTTSPAAVGGIINICNGQSITFTDNSTGTIGRLWDFGNGYYSSNQTHTQVYNFPPANYTVKLTVYDACGNAYDTTLTVIVDPSTGPDITCISVVCPGDTVTYHTSANCTTYNWSVTGGVFFPVPSTSSDSATVIWGPGPTGTISLSVSGCTPPSTCAIATVKTVHIVPATLPVKGDTIVCSGSSSTYCIACIPGNIHTWTVTPAAAYDSISYNDCCVTIHWKNTFAGIATVLVNYNNVLTGSGCNLPDGCPTDHGCGGTGNLSVDVRAIFGISGPTKVCPNSVSAPFNSMNLTTNTIVPGTSWKLVTPVPSTINFANTGLLNAYTWNAGVGIYTLTAYAPPGIYCNDSAIMNVEVVDIKIPNVITGPDTVCPGSTHFYAVQPNMSGVQYIWNVTGSGTPFGITITAAPTLAVTWGAGGGTVSVQQQLIASPFCTSLSAPAFTVVTYPPFALPVVTANPSGPTCLKTAVTYCIPPALISNATYTWSVVPATAGNITTANGGNCITVQWVDGTITPIFVKLKISRCYDDSVMFPVTLLALPPVPSISYAPLLICKGSPVSFSTTSPGPVWTWNFGDLGTSPLQNPTHSYTTAGNFNVSLTVTNANGCSDTAFTSVHVEDVPVLPVITGTSSVCVGSFGSYSFSEPFFAGGLYVWSLSSGGVITSGQGTNNINVQWNTAGPHQVLLSVTSLCPAGSVIPFNVTVNPLPTVSINIPSPSCVGSPLTFSSSGSPVVSYSWSFSGGTPAASTLPSPTVTYGVVGTYPVALTVVDANGCSSSALSSITIHELPIAFITTPNDDGCTFPFNVSLSAVNSGGYSFAWTPSGSGPTITPTITALTTYQCLVTNVFGCTALSNTITFNDGNCSPAPPQPGDCVTSDTINFTATPPLCLSDTFTVNGTALPPFNWFFDYAGATGTGSPVNYTYTYPGLYKVTVCGMGRGFIYPALTTPCPNVPICKRKPVRIPFDARFTMNAGCVGNVMQVSIANNSLYLDGAGLYTWNWYLDGSVVPFSSAVNPANQVFSSGPHNVTLIISDPSNTLATCTLTVPIVVPVPIVASFTSPAQICKGFPAAFLDTSTPTALTRLWTSAGAASTITNPANLIYTVAGPTTVVLTVSDIYGCTSTASANVNVQAGAGTLTVVNNNSCDSVQLIASGNPNYIWTYFSPVPSVLASSVYVKASGFYSVTATDPSSGCPYSATTPLVTVKQPPLVTITGKTVYCQGEKLDLKTSSAGTVVWRYSLDGFTSIQGTLPNMTNVASVPGTIVYMVTVTGINGCSASATISIVVDPVPAAASIVGGPATICDGDSVNLSVAPPGATYIWSKSPPPPLSSPANTAPSIWVTKSGTYSVIVQTASGCYYPAIAPKSITVNPLPAVKISGDTVLCAGETLLLSTINVGGATYVWSGPGGGGTSNPLQINNMLVSGSGTYTVIVTNTFGCTASASINVIVHPNPVVPFIDANVPGVLCEGQLYTDSVIPPTIDTSLNPLDYAWNTGQQGYKIFAAKAGSYYVTATNQWGCTSVSNTLTIYPRPDLSCAPTGCYDFCSDCDTVVIPGPGGIAGYQWEKDSAGTFYYYANTMNLSVYPPGGIFRLVAFNMYGCSDTTGILTVDFHECCPPPDTCPPCYTSVPDKVENGNFSLGNTGFTSMLNMACVCQVSSYCISTNSNLKCNLFANATDHTGNATPNFMIIDGSPQANQDVWSQNVNVVNNGLYKFSFWVRPVEPNNGFARPDLQMMINGNPVGPVILGTSMPYTSWTQFTTNWTSNVNGLVSIAIRQVNASGSGNDYGLDDIEFKGCEPVIHVDAGNDTTICAGTCIVITAQSSDSGLVYQWYSNGMPIAGANSYEMNICPEHDTCFTVVACDALGCCDSDVVCIYIHHPVPLTWNGLPAQLCVNAAPFSLVPYASPAGGTFSGPGVTGNIFNPGAASAGSHTITYTYPDSSGCLDTVSAVIVVVNCDCDTICIDFNDQQLHGFGPDPAAPNVLVTSSNLQSQGGTNDYYIRATDLPGPSALSAGSSFNGTWCCGDFCYDFRLFDDGGMAGSPNVNPVFYVWSGSLGFAFKSNVLVNETSGWHRICAPVSNCEMPAPFEGAGWDTIPGTGTTPADWNTVMNNVTKVNFKVDFNFPGDEITGFDNVCFTPSPIYLSCSGTNATCQGVNNGTVSVTVSGGHAPYTYQWSNSQTTQTATGLPAGTYCVTVTDSYGCCDSCCVTITGGVVVTDTVTHINCDSIYGHIYTTVTGGQVPYHYDWSNGATTADISVLQAGTYTVTVIDNGGCTVTHTATVTVSGNCNCNSIPPPPPPTITINSVDGDNCNNSGCIHATFTGCCLRYSYSYYPCDPLLAYSIAPTTDSNVFCNLRAGNYVLYVSDLCGNFVTANVVVPLLNGPLNATVSLGNCVNNVCVNPSGGCPPYTYLWSNGQTTSCLVNPNHCVSYSVTITDSYGCAITKNVAVPSITFDNIVNPSCCNANGSLCVFGCFGPGPLTYLWSNGLTTQCIGGLTAGNYCVTVTNANGMTVSCCYNLTQVMPPPPAVTFNFTGCGTTVNAIVDYQCPGYTYYWSNGNSTSLTRDNMVPCANDTLTIVDCNGVAYVHPFTVPHINAVITPINCLTGVGSICVTVDCFRCAPYSYSWTPSAPCATNNQSCISCTVPGVYTVCITNACGDVICCSYTLAYSAGISLTTVGSALNCFGLTNGTAGVNASGGTAPYSYSWNTNPVKTTAGINGLAAGIYTVTVTDANGCTATATAVVTQPALINNNPVVVQVSCRGTATGSISLSTTGGTAPYTYLWNNGSTIKNRNGLAAGTYTVTVTDANGCVKIQVFTITQPATNLIINTTKTNVRCFGAASGDATVSPSGGVGPYTYLWSNGKTTANVSALLAGVYTCTVTDNVGCIKMVVITITQSTQIIITQSQTNVTFPGGANGTATAAVSGGVGPYTYSWNTNPVSTTSTVTGLHAGVYKLSVADTKGCVVKATYVITEPTPRAPSGNVGDGEFKVSLFPNPTSGKVTLDFGGYSGKMNYEVTLYDLTGRIVYHQLSMKEEETNAVVYELGMLTKGIYFMKVSAEQGNKTLRIVLQ